jgi:uncharacterized protein (TIGR00290 family)
MHGIRRSVLRRQSEALGLPCFESELPTPAANDDYDSAWAGAIGRARAALGAVDHVAYGDLFLEDVRAYREAQAARRGFEPVFPIWGRDTGPLAREFVAAGYEAYLCCVDTDQLDGRFAGRRYDDALLDQLPASVDPCGERGEFHTCVVSGPMFAERIAVHAGERVLRERRFQYCDLIPDGDV